MNNTQPLFSFHMYTEILFGKDAELEVGSLVKKYGGSKAMIVYGQGSVQKSGLLGRVCASLTKQGIPYAEWGGVKANPLRSFAQEGCDTAFRENVDFVLGIGGASAIDTAKAIALGLQNGGEFWSFYAGSRPLAMAPVGAVHTISAAGSETSGSTVLIDDMETGKKMGMMYPDVVRPVFAAMNPELTYTVPDGQKAAGASDIIAHTFDRYFVKDAACALSDEFAEGLMRTVVKYAPVALKNQTDYESHAELMLAGSFSHNDVTGLGGKSPSAGTHNLEANISGLYNTTHGAGLAVIMPAWLEEVARRGGEREVERAARFGRSVFGAADPDPKQAAIKGTECFRRWCGEIGLPQTFDDMGIHKEELGKMVEACRCGPDGVMRGYIDFDKADVKAFFEKLFK